MSWMVLTYTQAAPFSLRLSVATTAAAVTALVPSPACVKLALVDAAFQQRRDERAARWVFDTVKGREVRVGVPEAIVVYKTFGRVLVPWESHGKKERKGGEIEKAKADKQYPFKRTIAFREMAYWAGPVRIAMEAGGLHAAEREELERLAWGVGYLGKRGSFVQLRSVEDAQDERVSCAHAGYAARADRLASSDWPARFVQRPTDDFGPEASFENVVITSDRRMRVGDAGDLSSPRNVDRFVAIPFVLPLCLTRSGRTYDLYERTRPS